MREAVPLTIDDGLQVVHNKRKRRDRQCALPRASPRPRKGPTGTPKPPVGPKVLARYAQLSGSDSAIQELSGEFGAAYAPVVVTHASICDKRYLYGLYEEHMPPALMPVWVLCRGTGDTHTSAHVRVRRGFET